MDLSDLKVISDGYCFAKTFTITDFTNYKTKTNDINKEIKRFFKAIETANKDLEGEDDAYFTIQKLMLNDPTLKNNVINLIETKKLTAEAAITAAIKDFKNNLLNANSRYLQERIYDVEDMCKRLLNILVDNKYSFPSTDFILVVDELMPSILLENIKHIKGIIAKKAGYLSHGAILARTLEIPFITTNLKIENNIPLIIDTRCKRLILNPTTDEINSTIAKTSENILIKPHDGYLLLANVFGNEEISKVKKYQFDGIGLYRTEFVFMHNNRPLTYDEQYRIYSKAVLTLGPKPFCFRTFDIGDDKQIPYLKTHKKGFLNYVNNKEMFETQIKAFINANIYGQMKIMFPMIETKEEFNYLKSWVLKIKKELGNTSSLEIGMMLETKEALEHIYDFTEADFFSIGTNDLSMQLYHIDREKAKKIPNKLIVDLQNKLIDVVNFCNKTNKGLSMCGELAAMPEACNMFLKIGLKNFSVSPSAFKNLNETVNNYINKKEC